MKTMKDMYLGKHRKTYSNKSASFVVRTMTGYELQNCLQKGIRLEVVGTANADNLRRAILKLQHISPSVSYKKSWNALHNYGDLHRRKVANLIGRKKLKRESTSHWRVNHGTGTFEIGDGKRKEAYLSLEELEQRFVVIMKRELRNFIVEYKEDIEYNIQNDKTTPTVSSIFGSWVDENKLAGCFKQLYYDYFNEDGVCTLEGKCDKMTFAAYLFVLVESERLGNDHFSSKAKNDFYTFINKKAFSLDKTDKTFRNRLNKLKDFRHKLLNMQAKEKPDVAIQANSHYKNFHTIMETFHNMPYYLETFKIRD